MDRNSAIGLTLIAVLLLVYFNFFSPEPPKPVTPPTATTEEADTTGNQTSPADSTPVFPSETQSKGEEKLTKIETGDLVLTFSNYGGALREVELKQFKTYYQKPLILLASSNSKMRLNATLEGRDVDLYSLYYTAETRSVKDSTIVAFKTTLSDGKSISHIYSIPSSGYQVDYKIRTAGLSSSINGEFLTFLWDDRIPSVEKDINASRVNSTINYYTVDGFDGLSESSPDPDSESLAGSVKWVGIKQKFFTTAIIARAPFSGGEVSTQIPADTSIVKTASVKLFIPKKDFVSNNADFQFFFGPNDYEVLSDITDGFSRNLYLGWPPVIWINKFVIIPIFHFLENYVSNYGVIIMIMVIIIKLILTPLSYTSYLGMAKMRLLKPELDLIKEKNGDNMTQTQQDSMKLYSQAGVNPFAGCIPLLLQMPILFAMFYFFPVSVELRQEAFLWAEDLSTYDSIATLPFTIPFYGAHVSLFVLLMTASTLVSTWQNNQISTVTGPMKSMSYIMPVIFMFVLNSFSAGLSFYYFISNLVTFAQQAIIKRFVNEDKIMAVMEDHKKKMAAGGTTTKSPFMAKLNEAMKKAQEEQRKKKK